MLKSTVKIGNELERRQSSLFHSNHLPILISSKLLRSKGLGQVDLCRLNGESSCIELAEVKKSGVISIAQRKRLFASLSYLSAIFNRNSKLILIHASH